MSNHFAVGETVVAVRLLTESEMDDLGWSGEQPVEVLILSDGTFVVPSQDDEGNGPGVLWFMDMEDEDEGEDT